MHTLVVKGHYLRGDICLVKESEVQRMKRVSYSSVIESLMYTVLCARLDMFCRWLCKPISVCEAENQII